MILMRQKPPERPIYAGFRPIEAWLPHVMAIVTRAPDASVCKAPMQAIGAGRCIRTDLSFLDRQGASKQACGDLTGRHRPPTWGTHAVQAVGRGGNPVTLGLSEPPGIQPC